MDVSQSTAWFLTEKIMLVIDRTKALSLFGIIEVDEAFIGNLPPRTYKEIIAARAESARRGLKHF